MREGSYREIQRGMRVVAPGGEPHSARVDQVLYDQASDIFIGLVIDPGELLTRRRLMVPGDRVVSVREGDVEVDVPLASLQTYVSPRERSARTTRQYERRR